jgi:hypothetical protein
MQTAPAAAAARTIPVACNDTVVRRRADNRRAAEHEDDVLNRPLGPKRGRGNSLGVIFQAHLQLNQVRD